MRCPLCHTNNIPHYTKDAQRSYFRCETCSLITAETTSFLSLKDEEKRYDTHNNSNSDSGYRKYLSGVLSKAKEAGITFTKESQVLDYGAGKEFVLTHLLREEGIACTPYDPLYGMTISNDKQFDTIIACEVIEHFQNPKEELHRINSHLQSGGYLYIRTGLTDTISDFAKWWYRNDPTHIIFFNSETMHYIAKEFHWELLHCENPDKILFRKSL